MTQAILPNYFGITGASLHVGQTAAAPGFAQAVAGMAALTAGAASSEAASGTEAVSLEDMLREKYPNITYHVFDASSSYWKTRNDYPHYLLYQSGDEAKETLENWKPFGPNPFYGSIDGRFIAPKEIHALSSVPPGSKAVVIHPKVQEKMEQDPAYAKEIFMRIDAWFALDVARNEAIMPGSTIGMNQAVAIGEDGNICNAAASGSGGTLTYSGSKDEEDAVNWWDIRREHAAYFAALFTEEQIKHAQELSAQFSQNNFAKVQLSQLLNDESFRKILGDTIAGNSTDMILAQTKELVWGGMAALQPHAG